MADKIEQQILNAEKAITDLTAKIKTLKGELESGNWGTQQLGAMQEQLNKLNTTLSKKVGRRESLISQQDAQNAERLNKALESSKRQLDYLRSEKTSRVAGNTPFLDYSPEQLEREIAKYERAVKSFQSRIASKNLQPSGGHTFTPELVNSPNDPGYNRLKPIETPNAADIEKRINQAVVGMPLTNAELTAKIKEAREIALNSLYGTPGTGAGKASNISTPAGILETGGYKSGPVPTVAPNKAGEELAASTAAFNAELGGTSKSAERAAKAAEAARKEEERLASIREKVATDPRYREALQQAEARGLGIGNLTNIEDRGGNVQRLKFAQTQGGINQQFNPYVNMLSGKSTPGLSSQFRTFGSDILRDIGQFTKWSIAIAAVYTPMQKLGELMTIMVDNESRLADATIAANVPFEKSGEIFDTVAVSANAAGESINTTIDAYTQAIRAAGRYADEGQKSAQATALLNDSLILSKLSTLDQSDAIDTLSAALLQSDRELNQGQELLNKWVRVSQVANVGIDALAVGVAVLGDAAETSGVDIDHLNALIAVLSEQSISGSKEAANTAKALVGAYQSDKAEAALNKYGIALRRANGEVRGFLEIYQELAQLRQQGILSESAVSEIALALGGGGVRRAKDASALINSTERLNQLAAESAAITGEDSLANDSLAKKLETVQTANTRLANSFQELAQTLGDDGGLLDGIKTLVNLLTGAVKVTNELFSVLGRSGPILATVVAGLGAMNAYYGVGGRKETALGRMGAQGNFLGIGGSGKPIYGSLTNGTGGGPLADILRMNYRGAGIIGGAGVALQGASNIAAGRNQNALANVLGGLVGGAIGAALGGPIGLAAGANIGSAAGDAMTTAVMNYKPQWENFFSEVFKPTPENKPEPAGDKTPEQLAEERRQALTPEGATKSGVSDLVARIGAGLLNIAPKAYFESNFFKNSPVGKSLIGDIKNPQYTGQDVTAQQYQFAFSPKSYQDAVRKEKEFQDDLAKARQEGADTIENIETTTNRERLEKRASVARREQLNRLATGEITTAEYGRVTNQISGFPSTSVKAVKDFGDEITKVSSDIKTTQDAYDAFLYIATNGTQEQINLISGYSDDIRALQRYIDNWNPEFKGVELKLSFGNYTIKSKDDLEKLLLDLQKQGSTVLGVTLKQVQQQQGQKITLPPLVGDYNKPTAMEDYNKAVEKGKEIQLQFYQSVGKTDDEIKSLITGIETFYTTVDTGSQTIFKATSGLEQRFYDLAKAAEEASAAFGLQQFDVDRATLERLAQQSIQLGAGWQNQTKNDALPGYFETKPEDLLAITNDGLVKPIHADMRILALLLQELNDKSQKQLDGQYNIPEGATFWVPLTAAYYRNKDNGSSGLQSMLDSLAVDNNTSATDANTQALKDATDKWANIDPQLATKIRGGLNPNQDRYDKMNEKKVNLTDRYDFMNKTPSRLPNEDRYDKMNTVQQAQSTTLIDQLKNFFNGFYESIKQFNQSQGLGVPVGGSNGAGRTLNNQSQTLAPTTKLDLKLSSNVNLLVDGRVLAQTLQTYFASELLRTEQTQGTITKRYTI
jgi:TP901 family phage tail tape measure protein